MDKCIVLSIGVVAIIVTLFLLSMGISEAVYLSKYDSTETKGECWQVWPNLVSVCVLNFVCGILLIPTIIAAIIGGKSDKGKSDSSASLAGAIRIWTCVIYFNITSSCREYYEDNAPELLTFLEAETCLFLIYCGCLGLLCVGVIIWGCSKCCCPNGTNDKYHAQTDNPLYSSEA